MKRSTPAVLGFAAFSGTGKTTLLERLIPELKRRGLRVGIIKHAHHDFDVDQPGKDSYRLRHAGARQVLVASRKRWALMTEEPEFGDEPRLGELLPHLDGSSLDLILVEGFKHEDIPKIEIHRATLHKPLLFPDDPDIIAIACDGPIGQAMHPPLLDINDPCAIADFIAGFIADTP